MGNALHTPGTPGVGLVTPAEARLDDAGLIAVQGPGLLDVRTGVLHGPGSTALLVGTSDTAPMTVQINPHHWVTTRQATDGVYRGAAEVAKKVDIGAAPGSGTRIDVVYVKQADAQSTINPDATSEPEYGVLEGTAGGGKPDLAAEVTGAEEVGTVAVSPGATSTNGAGVTITNTAVQTVARGARVPVRSLTERNALTAYAGLEVYRIDTGQVQLSNGSAWATVYDPNGPVSARLGGSGTQTGVTSGVVTKANLSTTVRNNGMTVSTGRLTAVTAGLYLVSGMVSISSSVTGIRLARLRKNGVDVTESTHSSTPGPANWRIPTATVQEWLNVGDYVEVCGYHEAGSDLSFLLGESFLQATRIG